MTTRTGLLQEKKDMLENEPKIYRWGATEDPTLAKAYANDHCKLVHMVRERSVLDSKMSQILHHGTHRG
jgi:hypothetical protein